MDVVGRGQPVELLWVALVDELVRLVRGHTCGQRGVVVGHPVGDEALPIRHRQVEHLCLTKGHGHHGIVEVVGRLEGLEVSDYFGVGPQTPSHSQRGTKP